MKFLASLLALICLACPVWAGKHALIISNAQYEDLSDLRNTHADADAYAEVFAGFGYDITRLRDSGLDETEDALDVFLSQLDPGDEVAVVFSGHGWSDGQVNYLVPVDAPLQGSDRKLKRETIALKDGAEGLLDEIEARSVGLTVAIIDACRDNPFKPPEGRKSTAVSKGLVRVTPRTGSFIVYSAGEGQQALDRLPSDPADQKLSVFTRIFVPYLKQRLHLEEAISRAQVDTAALAQSFGGHRQEPAYYDATLGLTCIARNCTSGEAEPAQDPSAEADKLLITALSLPKDVQAIALKRIVEGFAGTAAAKAASDRLAVLERQQSAAQTDANSVERIAPDSGSFSRAYWETERQKLMGHSFWVFSASFSSDGTRILTTTSNTTRVWDAATGRFVAQLIGGTGSVPLSTFSPDGRLIATATENEVQVWEAVTGRIVLTLSGHLGEVESVSFSPNGSQIVTASRDNTARVWDANTGKEVIALLGHSDDVKTAVFSSNGSQVLTASGDKTARIWDVRSGNEVTSLTEHSSNLYTVAFSSDGSRILTTSGDKSARVWDTESGQETARLSVHGRWQARAAFSPDGTKIVTWSGEEVLVWDSVSGQKLVQLQGHEDLVFSAVFSPDGKRIVTASADNTARVWDAKSGHELALLSGHLDAVFSAVFSPEGSRILTASADKTARVWGGN